MLNLDLDHELRLDDAAHLCRRDGQIQHLHKPKHYQELTTQKAVRFNNLLSLAFPNLAKS